MNRTVPMNRTVTAIAWIVRLSLGALFIAAGVLKLRDPNGFAVEIANYQLFPPLAPYLAAALPVTEMVLGAVVVAAPGPWRRAGALAMAALLGLFTVATAMALLRGINIDCGCFGRAGGPITAATIVRDLILLGATAVCFVEPSGSAARPIAP